MDYPREAGFTEPTTSKDAADAIEGTGRAPMLREWVLNVFRNDINATSRHRLPPVELTADEVAEQLAQSPFSIRPRITELSKQGLIERTGERRRSCNGKLSHVWRLVRD